MAVCRVGAVSPEVELAHARSLQLPRRLGGSVVFGDCGNAEVIIYNKYKIGCVLQSADDRVGVTRGQ